MRPSLAWVYFDPEAAGGHPNPELAIYWYASLHEAERLGYHLEVFVLPTGNSLSALESVLHGHNVAGVLFPPEQKECVPRRDLPVGGLPAVCTGHFAAMSRARFVTYDHLSDAANAFEQVWTKGYRRIGLVCDTSSSSELYWAGFIHARSRKTRAPVVPALELTKQDPETTAAWLRRHRPDALVFEHRGLLQKLERDVSFPADIGVVLLDIHPDEPQGFAGMRRNEAEIGRLAVQTLVQQIIDNTSAKALPFCHVLIESE